MRKTGSEKLSNVSGDRTMVTTQHGLLPKIIFACYLYISRMLAGVILETFCGKILVSEYLIFLLLFSSPDFFRHNYGHKDCGRRL